MLSGMPNRDRDGEAAGEASGAAATFLPPSPAARTVVAAIAGKRIGLNMMKRGVDTANATAEPLSVTPAKPKYTTDATEATTILITSNIGRRKGNKLKKENILPWV
ncbi:hypothetical protein BRARA_J02524 [Brassica rapa]|uniref:Uncharacterized protein n=1 Tax=Brassica campestris TaxID=3711 RepID=A0A397XT49_BRACM|nr:hypothetical protein BRARA_J02524 [Brassica rapa]